MSVTRQASPVAPGEIIAGKYRVQRTLGVGGMGVVVAATHVDLNQKVALKFLLPEAAGHPDLIERFGREARAVAQILSEHVARVIDVGTLDTGIPYMVMEYLEGQDLHDARKGAPPIAVETAVGHVLHAIEALAEAHSLGIVHRDLKPANLFLAQRPNGTAVVKVLDFGISKSTLTNDESGLTKASTMVGSPSYMAPEQIRSARSVDARADQWSLGVILYELLSGDKPFQAESISELVFVILDRPHAPLLSLRPEVPEGLALVIDRCLAKDPAGRFRSVADLARALVPFGPDWSFASAQRSAHVLGLGLEIELDATESSSALLSVPDTPSELAVPVADPAVTGAPWSQSSQSGAVPLPAPPPPRSMLIPVAAGMLAAGALVGAVVFTLGSFGGPSAPPVAAVAPPTVEAPPPPAPTATALPAAAETPLALPPPAASASASASPDVPPPQVRKAKAVAAPKPSSAASAAAPRCATVTFFDSDGMKHFRQECK